MDIQKLKKYRFIKNLSIKSSGDSVRLMLELFNLKDGTTKYTEYHFDPTGIKKLKASGLKDIDGEGVAEIFNFGVYYKRYIKTLLTYIREIHDTWKCIKLDYSNAERPEVDFDIKTIVTELNDTFHTKLSYDEDVKKNSYIPFWSIFKEVDNISTGFDYDNVFINGFSLRYILAELSDIKDTLNHETLKLWTDELLYESQVLRNAVETLTKQIRYDNSEFIRKMLAENEPEKYKLIEKLNIVSFSF